MTRGEGGWLLLPSAGLSPAILRQFAWRTTAHAFSNRMQAASNATSAPTRSSRQFGRETRTRWVSVRQYRMSLCFRHSTVPPVRIGPRSPARTTLRATAQSPSRSFGSGTRSAPTARSRLFWWSRVHGPDCRFAAGLWPATRQVVPGPPMRAGFASHCLACSPGAFTWAFCAVSTASSRPFKRSNFRLSSRTS